MVPGFSPWSVTVETKRAPRDGRSFYARTKNGRHGGRPCRPLMGIASTGGIYILQPMMHRRAVIESDSPDFLYVGFISRVEKVDGGDFIGLWWLFGKGKKEINS